MTHAAEALSLRWAKAMAHPIRVRIIKHVVSVPLVSPSELCEPLGLPVGVVSYHMRRLERLGFLTLEKCTPVRGTQQHHYGLSDRELAIRLLENGDDVPREEPAAKVEVVRRHMKALGSRVRALREAQGVSIPDLADGAGLTATGLERIERGDADPRMSVVCRLADRLNLTLVDVLREVR